MIRKITLFLIFISFYNYTIGQEAVKIGEQEWMTKNLDVDKYRNGDPIPQVQDPKEWMKLTTGAWCYFENKTENGAIYGKLYNWYAVNDPRGLAPQGYHVPSGKELKQLIEFLGGYGVAGLKLKNTTGWNSFEKKSGNGTNESKFGALPGGVRSIPDGVFKYAGDIGYYWSSSASGPGYASEIIVSRKSARISGGAVPHNDGHSVRCVKD